MRVLIACEYSGITRDAFAALGHDAWSCDLLPTERPGNHIQENALEVINAGGWDLLIAHPPCTYTSIAGNRWFKTQPDRLEKARLGFEFFMKFVNAPIPLIAVENTRGLLWQWYRRPDQVLHPYMFGEPVQKSVCLWLKGLPRLWYTTQPDFFGNQQTVCDEYLSNWTTRKQGSHTGKSRSKTFVCIANAMAEQWSK